MRPALQFAIGICVIGCSGDSLPEIEHLAPPTPRVSASNGVVSTSAGLSLEVTTLVTNPTAVVFKVNAGAQCPAIRIFSDPSGEAQTLAGPSPCPPAATVDLAPGDTIILKRVVPPDSLSSYSPGLYGVGVQVVTDRVVMGAWAGTVTLPLARTP